MVTADFQYKGRGRNGKDWIGNADENLFCSFGISHRDIISDNVPMALQAAGSLLALDMLASVAPSIRFGLKYPNDVYAHYAGNQFKIAGVLVENEYIGSVLQSSVIGIGVNLLQSHFSSDLNAVSLLQLGVGGTPKIAAEYFYEYAGKFFTEAISFPALTLSRWNEVLGIKGRKIHILKTKTTGVALGLSSEGHLLVQDPITDQISVCSNGDSIVYEIF